MQTTIEFDWGACSVVGHVRKVNEDSFVATPPVFAVADGMGGHAKGDVASAIVIHELAQLSGRSQIESDAVATAIERANQAVHAQGAHSPDATGMGTTLTAAVMVTTGTENTWLVVNVGDSRIYRVHDDCIEQLTIDHSLVQEYVDAGRISAADARRHPERNVITRAMGLDDAVLADFLIHTPQPGERLVLCSDGVHGELDDDDIACIVTEARSAQQAADAIIDRVLAGRARDNATVVVVEVVGLTATLEPQESTGPIHAVITGVPNAALPTAAPDALDSDRGQPLPMVSSPPLTTTSTASAEPDGPSLGMIATVPSAPTRSDSTDDVPTAMITMPHVPSESTASEASRPTTAEVDNP